MQQSFWEGKNHKVPVGFGVGHRDGMHGIEVETEGGFPRCHKGRRSKERVVDIEVG